MSKLGEIIKQIKDGAITVVHIRDIDFNTIEDGELKDLAGYITAIIMNRCNHKYLSEEQKMIFLQKAR